MSLSAQNMHFFKLLFHLLAGAGQQHSLETFFWKLLLNFQIAML